MSNFLNWLFVIGFLAACVFGSYKFGEPYYKQYKLRSEVELLLSQPIQSLDDLRVRLDGKSRELGVVVPLDSWYIEQNEVGGYKVYVSWTNTVNIFDKYKQTDTYFVNASN